MSAVTPRNNLGMLLALRWSAREAREHARKGRACVHCGEPLDVEARADARFCRPACRVAALREARRTRGVDG